MIKPIRINKPVIPLKKVTPVLPRPFKMLVSVVFKYKNGQIQASTVMKFPARELENTNFPRKFPNIKKNKRHPKPKSRQKENVF